MNGTAHINRRRVVLVVAALVLGVVALSFILPYVGGGHGITPLP
ncbi:MAG: hypothetical protein ABI990_06650 [Actinomycetota bacterium]